MSSADEIAVHVIIEGRVQGVWFRAWTVQEARARGLRGWVRNRRDRTVEAVICGPADKVADMIAVLHRGSPASRVDSVQQSPADLPDQVDFIKIASA